MSSYRGISAIGPSSGNCSVGISRALSSTLLQRAMSTVRSTGQTISFEPTYLARSRFWRRRAPIGEPSRVQRAKHSAFFMCLQTRFTALLLQRALHLPSALDTNRVARIRHRRRARITSCVPTIARYGLPTLITNCSNNYGPFQFPEKLIPLMIHNAVRGKPLPVYGDGTNIRDWLYVADHCAAIGLVLANARPGETYNIGGRSEQSNLEVVRAVCAVLDELCPDSVVRPHESLISFVKDRPGHDFRYAMDTTKIERELSWQPRDTFESGIWKTVRWYLDNAEWVRTVADAYRDWIARQYGTGPQPDAEVERK